MAAARIFLTDFPQGMKEGRYLDQSLPHLGFREGESDIALCSHFLFTYSDRLSLPAWWRRDARIEQDLSEVHWGLAV